MEALTLQPVAVCGHLRSVEGLALDHRAARGARVRRADRPLAWQDTALRLRHRLLRLHVDNSRR